MPAGSDVRPRVLDHLQAYPFWLIDLSSIPFAGNAFSPTLGFQSCTSPEISVEMAEIREGNWFYPHHHIKSASVSSITLSRGVQFYDTDFYKWFMLALQGQGIVKRDLLLIHYFAISAVTLVEQIADDGRFAGAASLAAGVGSSMFARILTSIPAAAAVNLAATGAAGAVDQFMRNNIPGGFNPPVEFAPRFPAKAWKLKHCVPTRWKSTSDFDAASGDVSIAELEIAPHRIEELAITTD